MSIDDGGPAFPAMLPGGNYCLPGMTLLDWFAGKAMEGILASDSVPCQYNAIQVAEFAYDQANEMIFRRNKLLKGSDDDNNN